MNFQMFNLDLGKAEDQRSNHQHPLDHQKNGRVPEKKIYFCFIDYAKAFDCVNRNKLWKILQQMGIPIPWPASWDICMQFKKPQLELDMKKSKLVWNQERSMSRLYIVPLFI